MICDADAELDVLANKMAMIAQATLLDTVNEGGVEVVGEGGAFAAPGGNGPLVLRMDDIPADASTTATLSVGETVTGVLDVVGDRDWYAVEMVEGGRYTFALDAAVVNGDSIGDAFLWLHDATGNILTFNDDGGQGTNSFISFTASETGTFYISAAAYNDGALDGTYDPDGVGGYQLTMGEAEPLRDYTLDEVADFLTDGYWESTGRAGRAFAETNLTYNVDSLADPSVIPLIEAALQAWADVTPLTFTRTSDFGASILFQDAEDGAYSVPTQIDTATGVVTQSRINVGPNWTENYGTDIDSYNYQTFIHEIGHTLGLGHAGPYNGGATYGVDNIYTNDNWNTSVMSYFSQNEANSGTYRYVLGLQIGDILAIQNLYGAAESTRGGDTVYGFNATDTGSIFDFQNWVDRGGEVPSFAIYDTDGIDTFDVSGFGTDQIISLVQESFSSVGTSFRNPGFALVNVVSIARDAVIENAIGGSGNDTFIGNAADNLFTGGLGSDTANGGEGEDTFIMALSSAEVTVVENADGSFTLTSAEGTDVLTNFEFIQFTDGLRDLTNPPAPSGVTEVGTDGNDTIVGTDFDDTLGGGRGNDVFTPLRGDDTVDGGTGRDTVVLSGDFADYAITANADGSYTVAGPDGVNTISSIELLQFDDQTVDTSVVTRVVGTSAEDALAGTIYRDILIGVGGDDTINADAGNDQAFGGDGADTINGGFGNDRLFGQNGEDTIDGGAGRDIISGGNGVDTLSGGDGVDILYGNADNDLMYGNAGSDRLIGGTGDDLVDGGAGRDVLLGQAGNDTIQGGADVDYLSGGTGDDTISGGLGNDRLLGNEGQDVLIADFGRDIMIGGADADTFMVMSTSDLAFVADFENGVDRIDLSDFDLSGSTLEAAGIELTQLSGRVRVTVDGEDVAFLLGETVADIDFSDFVL